MRGRRGLLRPAAGGPPPGDVEAAPRRRPRRSRGRSRGRPEPGGRHEVARSVSSGRSSAFETAKRPVRLRPRDRRVSGGRHRGGMGRDEPQLVGELLVGLPEVVALLHPQPQARAVAAELAVTGGGRSDAGWVTRADRCARMMTAPGRSRTVPRGLAENRTWSRRP